MKNFFSNSNSKNIFLVLFVVTIGLVVLVLQKSRDKENAASLQPSDGKVSLEAEGQVPSENGEVKSSGEEKNLNSKDTNRENPAPQMGKSLGSGDGEAAGGGGSQQSGSSRDSDATAGKKSALSNEALRSLAADSTKLFVESDVNLWTPEKLAAEFASRGVELSQTQQGNVNSQRKVLTETKKDLGVTFESYFWVSEGAPPGFSHVRMSFGLKGSEAGAALKDIEAVARESGWEIDQSDKARVRALKGGWELMAVVRESELSLTFEAQQH